MSEGRALCLNMIVKNERTNIERCLSAVVDHVACWVIGDTGSTDGTQDFITSFFAARNLSGELHSFPFRNFEQARNAALDCAAASPLDYDYLLFADADMELVVEDPAFRTRLEAPGYQLLQRTSSGLSYWNPRLASRKAGMRYHGVTHEYLDVPGGAQRLQGVWYKDHATGSNRTDKFERDIKLLEEALKEDPNNVRYWYYLAQSQRDARQTTKAAHSYAKRAEMGGWSEEAWHARLQEARCLLQLGDEKGFLHQALAAFNQRPHRAEPLHELARFYRERGMNDASILFSEPGLLLTRPEQDTLFIEDFVYSAGLQEEYSIAANYLRDPERKSRGSAACNWLALNRDIPARSRDLARSNLFFYYEAAGTLMPSFSARPIRFAAPDGYRPLNPSITQCGDQLLLAQRTVNYTLTKEGQYVTPNGAPIHTRNFLLALDHGLEVQSSAEILPPADMPQPAFNLVQGFEDMRLFAWRGELWCIACVRELTAQGWCEQVLARIDRSSETVHRLSDWQVLRPPGPRLHEKNWMPQVEGDRLQFIYLCDPTRVVDEQARTVSSKTPAVAAEQFRGGSQAIAFAGGWLALIHVAGARKGERYYEHRFVWFDSAGALRGVSRPFFFQQKGIEFAAGLCWHPDAKRLLISYSIADREAWIASVDADEVAAIIDDVDRLPSGKLGSIALGKLFKNPITAASVASASSDKTNGQGKGLAAMADGPADAAPDAAVVPSRDFTASARSPARLFTTHGTLVYADRSGQLQHGPPADSPLNAGLLSEGAHGTLVNQVGDGYQPIVCRPDRCQTAESQNTPDAPCTPTLLEILQLEAGQIALRAGGFFLCAEADGRVTLSRQSCSAWEQFRLDVPAIGRPQAGSPASASQDWFLRHAPFLRDVASPQDRRALSREFDARIAPFLRGDSAALPQIHCFYEVLSQGADHQTLTAATASMRAAGHPVRVWSYAPEKLAFLKSHGIELAEAADVVPVDLFKHVMSNSAVRYFSDLFRYALLYEHGGLWMDGDIVLLRPFPFCGDYFFNLQWRSGSKQQQHFICGNVMYARRHSQHLRNLYEASLERCFAPGSKEFGEIGPKLLSDYLSSERNHELHRYIFGPMFFNAIDWTELDLFSRPLSELSEYLNDERVFGIHLWNARTNSLARDEGVSLLSLLSDPIRNFPSLTVLAKQLGIDKAHPPSSGHCYHGIYDRLLSPRRLSLRRLIKIGLRNAPGGANQAATSPGALWQSYFPFCQVIGLDASNLSQFNNESFTSLTCDQANASEVRAVAAKLEHELKHGSIDAIVDGGSLTSYAEQLTLREFFPLLAPGGWYFIEDVNWQPRGESHGETTPTAKLLGELQQHGACRSGDPLGIGAMLPDFSEILLFSRDREPDRKNLLGGLVAIRKRGGSGLAP
jgi:glycosyltransferase involved in cell wall biosynthesis